MPIDLPPKLWLPPKPAIIRTLVREPLSLASFLPGMFPAGAAAAGSRITLTQVGSGSAHNSGGGAITSSVTIVAGDLLVIWGRANSGTGDSIFPPGFTSAVTSEDTGKIRSGIFYKIADGSEGTTVDGFVTDSGGMTYTNTLYVFRGDTPISSIQVGSPASQVTAGNPNVQVVSASGGTPPLVVIAGYRSDTAVNPRTFTVGGVGAKDGEINPAATTTHYLAYKIYNASPADVTVDMDDEGTGNVLASCYLACS